MTKKHFDELPIAKQRVTIARDLIARLDAKKFIAAGGYFQAEAGVLKVANNDVQVKEVFAGEVCRGCQIGGMFAAALDRANALKLCELADPNEVKGGAIDHHDLRAYLGRWFSTQTLEELEAAFEGWEIGELDEESHMDFAPFYDLHEHSADKRMRLICENIIVNKGTFKPRQILRLAKVA